MADKPKLTRAERKQIEAVIRKYRGDGKPHTAQDTIPYQIMYPDGICYLGNRRYSQSIEFFDINYLLAQPDDQTAIFEYLCDLYNYLDSSIHVQFTYPNRKSDREQLARSFEMPPCNDGLDPIRQEQTDILKRQLARGNNGSVKTKYITYTIEADNLKAARARLSRISLDIQGYFKIMGAVSRVLDGKERLEVLHGIMHPDGERFNFDWKWLAAGGLSTKDFIAPSSFAFKNKAAEKPDGRKKQMTSQSKDNRLLPLTVIEAAAGGDVEAINAVLKHYAGYIARLSMRELYDEYGNPHLCVDEELRRRLETKLITKLLTFRVR